MTEAAQKAAGIVAEAWGAAAPAWVKKLAAMCDETSQAKAAKKIALSASLVNMVLKRTYTGSMENVRSHVERASGTIDCPVLGEITFAKCHAEHTRPYNPANHVAVRLFVTCQKCPNNLTCKGKENDDHNGTTRNSELPAERNRWQRGG